MAMSDCEHCWETPCTCSNAYGYRHLSIKELEAIKGGISKLIEDKIKRGVKPDKREHR